MEREGVIKFAMDFSEQAAPRHEGLPELETWRRLLFRVGVIGQRADRYVGLAFGNVSLRSVEGEFLISGTQTGGMPTLNSTAYAHVLEFDMDRNWLRAAGKIKPSSEAMTHGAIYEAVPTANCVMHIHSPEIWHCALHRQIDVPVTAEIHSYGTPGMARAIYATAITFPGQPICMSGHEDGVIAYGTTPAQAGRRLLLSLAEAITRATSSSFFTE